MVEWSSLLLPALVSVVLIFFASFVIHMVLQLHKPDYRGLPNEDQVREAIRAGSPAPGQYTLPYCSEPKDQGLPAMQQKYAEGPVGVLFLGRSGPIRLGPYLGKWVVYTLVVSLLVGYLARVALLPGAGYLQVFRVVGVAAWLAYAWHGPADSIWKCKPWSLTLRELFDGLVYALLTAGAFAWLWPR